MGDNQAYSNFQQMVINLYDADRLDLVVLDILAEPYRDTDIDSGGDTGILTKDGKALEDVCIATIDPDWLPAKSANEKYTSVAWDGDWEAESRYEKWCDITRNRWGWS